MASTELIILRFKASIIILPNGMPETDFQNPSLLPFLLIEEIIQTGLLYNSFILPATIPIIPS